MTNKQYDKELKRGNAITRYWMLQEAIQEIILLSNRLKKEELERASKVNSKNLKKAWKKGMYKNRKQGVNKSELNNKIEVI